MVWSFLNRARADRENPEELPRIAELQKDLDTLKAETRQRLNAAVESKYQVAGLSYMFGRLHNEGRNRSILKNQPLIL